MREMKIWDLPTRLFHWALVTLFLVSWASAEFDYFTIHYYSGYGMFVLILFRLLWGLVGSDTSRLTACLSTPATLFSYLGELFSRKPGNDVGHNPLGGLGVLALLGLLVAQVTTGLFAQDIDFINSGPLSGLISFDAGNQASDLHHLIFDILLILIGVHLSAVAFHEGFKNERLISAMLWGWRRYGDDGPITPPTLIPTTRALIALLASAAVMAFVVWGLPGIL